LKKKAGVRAFFHGLFLATLKASFWHANRLFHGAGSYGLGARKRMGCILEIQRAVFAAFDQ